MQNGLELLRTTCGQLLECSEISNGKTRRFNQEYQDLYDQVPQNTIELEQRQQKLRQIESDFKTFAGAIAELIIVQQQFPPEQRFLRPREDVGGVAGGEKFVIGHVLFKFARDWLGIYGTVFNIFF
jgi:hypothetical protein